jgi:hypothetical protein
MSLPGRHDRHSVDDRHSSQKIVALQIKHYLSVSLIFEPEYVSAYYPAGHLSKHSKPLLLKTVPSTQKLTQLRFTLSFFKNGPFTQVALQALSIESPKVPEGQN